MVDFKTKASRDKFALIERPETGQRVHVEGWLAGMVFTYIGTNEHGEHVLRTRVSNKKYTTKNALLHLANDKETLRMNKK